MKKSINMDFFLEKTICVNIRNVKVPFIGILEEITDKYLILNDTRHNRTTFLSIADVATINTLDDLNAH